MATLKSMIASDAADGGVFLPKDSDGNATDFNELVTYYPRWDRYRKVTNVNCVVVRDNEEGTREVRGDGVVVNHRNGKNVRRSIMIECSAALDVRETQPDEAPDVFLIDGEYWPVKRIMGRDADLMTVLCIHNEDRDIRNRNRVG